MGRADASLIYLEAIRDFGCAMSEGASAIEQFIVVHESGHQFKLEHIDGMNGTPDVTWSTASERRFKM